MDKYNVKGLADFFMKHEFGENYRIDNKNIIWLKKGKKWDMVWGSDSGDYKINKTRTEHTIWGRIMNFDPEYGRMNYRQKVELVDMISARLAVA